MELRLSTYRPQIKTVRRVDPPMWERGLQSGKGGDAAVYGSTRGVGFNERENGHSEASAGRHRVCGGFFVVKV